jgi:hypothetical protein
VAGIAFSVLLTVAFVPVRLALRSHLDDAGDWLTDGRKRDALLLALNLMAFAGIAFLWFIGVVRDRIGAGEDRFFATVFWAAGCCSSPCSSRLVRSLAGSCSRPMTARPPTCGRSAGG